MTSFQPKRRARALLVRCGVGLLALGLPAVACAQDVDQLIVAAYSLRRRGKFVAAAAAFEQIIPRLEKKADKRFVALEAAELFRVMGKPEKAIKLYRKNNDVPREIETLLELGTDKAKQDALTISRYVKYPRGEARALAKLGKTDEALALMAKHGLERDRAKLLVELGRHAEAAAAYEAMRDFYQQARALERAGRQREAERAYEDAVVKQRADMREKGSSLQLVRTLEDMYGKAKSGVTRERTRLALAKAYGALGQDYRELASAYALSARRDYVGKAPTLATNALNFYRRQRELLEDEAGGGDAFGAKAVTQQGLPELIAEVQSEIERYQGMEGSR
jgi:tetratricopeptide (TPR) repeat protein